jgi:V/A-type H+-transporting ATPase subunit F
MTDQTHPLTLAVAGTQEFHLGFELAGVKTFILLPEDNPEETLQRLRAAMRNPTTGILIVEEERLGGIATVDRIELENTIHPVMVTLRRERSDSGHLRRQIIRAIGVDLLAPSASNEEQL